VAYLTELLIAEHHLNEHDFLRVEICNRRGKFVTRISRWKHSAGKVRRTGESFEFAARHIDALIAALSLADTVAQHLAASEIGWGAA
jgi:hypothetical protein